MKRIGHNDPCSCGSGKKHKLCCLPAESGVPPTSHPTTREISDALQTAIGHHQEGRLPQAEAIYQQILQTEPNHADALHLLGVICHQRGSNEIAVNLINRAIKERPLAFIYYSNLGNALQALGQLDEAIASYRQTLLLKPDYAEAYCNLGKALKAQDRLDEAIASYRQALLLRPNLAETHYNLGNALKEQDSLNEAAVSYRQALLLKPDLAEAHCNLGIVLQDQGRPDVAIASYLQALLLKPTYVEAYNNLGNSLQNIGELNGSVTCYQQALLLKPDLAEAHFHMAILLLACGQLEEGWVHYDYRHHLTSRHDFPCPHWAGEALGGKSILIWGEQGIGDELLFAGMYSEIAAQAGRCVIECAGRLVPLFSRSFPGTQVVAKTYPLPPATLEGFDYQCAAGSLARWLRPSLDCFPDYRQQQVPGYLVADIERVAHWKKRLDAIGTGTKVGVGWTSGDKSAKSLMCCTRLDQWGPIFGVNNVEFINLQYTDCREEIEAAEKQFGIKIHRWDDIDLKNDLDEVAALTTALDAVVSISSAVAVMAGALGKPVLTLNLRNSSAGWMHLGTDHMPWFPSMKLVHREWNEGWDGALDAVAQELSLMAKGS